MAGRGRLVGDQLLGHGEVVVIGALAVGLQRRLVPGRTELAAATDVGDHEGAAALQPQLADHRVVDRQLRQVEAAIGVQQGRVGPVQLPILLVDHEVGDGRAVLRGRRLLLDHQVLGLELGGQGLDGLGGGPGGVGQFQLRRGQEALDGVEDVVAFVGVRAQRHRGVVDHRQGLGLHAELAAQLQADQAAPDIVIDHGHHAVVGHRHLVDRLARTRRQQLAGIAVVADDDLGVLATVQEFARGGDDRAGRIGDGPRPDTDGPWLLDLQDELAVDQAAHADLLRDRQQAGHAVVPDVGLVVEEVGGAGQQHHGVPRRVVQHVRPGRDVGLLAAIDLDRLIQGLTALQGLDHEAVAAVGGRAFTPVAGQDQGVGIQPLDRLLALGQHEAAGRRIDEALGGQVELADRHGVLAAVRQVHQAAVVGLGAAIGALPDPVLALGLGQGVDVDDRFPLRVGGLVGFEARTPPDAAHMVGVLPEVEHRLADEVGHGDPVLAGQDLQRLGLQAGEPCVARQDRQGLVVLGLHPGQAVGAFHRLQRQVGVGLLRVRCSGEHGGQGRGGTGAEQGHGAGRYPKISPAPELGLGDQTPSSGMFSRTPHALQWTASGSCRRRPQAWH